jgi:hypothetical protein
VDDSRVGAIAARKNAVSHLDAVIPPASATSKASASTRFRTVRTPQWNCRCDPAIGKGEVASEMLAGGGNTREPIYTGGGRD